MKKIACVLSVLCVIFAVLGCQEVGECWPISEDGQGQGVGGGPLVPGSGGYGDVPPDPQATGDSPPPDCVEIGSYSPSLFKFKATLPDDGTDKGGGYQEATAIVKFVDGRQDPPASWSCSLWVGMPMRTAKHGTISPQPAAEFAADALTIAAGATMHSKSSWIQASFCKKLADNMVVVFANDSLGGSARGQ